MFKQTILPRWRGFNLLGAFITGSPGKFAEDDFWYVADLGFDFVRLPMSYIFWIDEGDPFKINEEKLSFLDEAIRFGEKYGLHVNAAFHRAPGFSVANDRVEPFNLWTDKEALDCFSLHWRTFAKRYKNVSTDKLSFNLVNEPAGVAPERHYPVMREAIGAIREVDAKRLIICDGLDYGNVPLTNMGYLAGMNVAQSCRAYQPIGITHYRSSWVDKNSDFPEPAWPGGWDGADSWDRARLEKTFGAWAALAENFNMGVHCGEGGCFNKTPHNVALRWLEDVLDILKGYNIGYALWNLKGGFGILDSGRDDVAYEDYHGHKLDKKMLDLLKKY